MGAFILVPQKPAAGSGRVRMDTNLRGPWEALAHLRHDPDQVAVLPLQREGIKIGRAHV